MYCCNKNRKRFRSVQFGYGHLKPLFEFTYICYALSSVIFLSVARTDRSSCCDSQSKEWTASALHSLSVTYCTAALRQWLSQQSHTTVVVDAAIRRSW